MVVKTFPKTQEQINWLIEMDSKEEYSFWNDIGMGHDVDIMVLSDQEENLNSELDEKGIKHNRMIADVGELMRLEEIPSSPMGKSSPAHPMTWNAYHSMEDMYAYFDFLEATYDFVSIETIGQSFEGRDMRVAKVCRGGCKNKPSIWIDGGIHAREWISIATVTWMLMELVENDATHPDLTQNMDW